MTKKTSSKSAIMTREQGIKYAQRLFMDQTYVCVLGVRNISFSDNFAYVPKERLLRVDPFSDQCFLSIQPESIMSLETKHSPQVDQY